MTSRPRNNAATTRGKPFERGNPGRRAGSRHKATVAAETLLDGEGEALTRKAIDMALAGDATALRLCLERLVPPRRDRPITFEAGEITGPADALGAVGRVIRAMSEGELTPAEATAVVGVMEGYRRAHETTEIERRLAALEERK